MGPGRAVVVGAGILGLWSALRLRQAGWEVEVVDGWEPGHPRATSGDENRVIRCGYGGARLYAGWAARALAAWRAAESEWGTRLLHRCGVLWMAASARAEPYLRSSLEDLRALGKPCAVLDPAELARRYPQVRTAGIRLALLEPDAGALMARRACLAAKEALERIGATFRRDWIGASTPAARSSRGSARRLEAARGASGARYEADRFLFACGPWLPSLFPQLLGRRIRVTHKEVFYFGTPAGDDRFDAARLPVWMELGAECYGVPSLEGKGFKLHPDLPGRRVDPTTMERRTSPRFLSMARACLARRFPALRGAPLLETRVCQYESTPDDHILLDRHPSLENVWMVGGGSGHAFKHAPVIGELAAEAVASGRRDGIPPELRLDHRPRGRHF
ncbi:MAG TPA: FAD-dependent oxidoreductase [Candidatus Polarisedimenticolia bacterium]|nr:FAD-dependent oxidoreductase [Candidatus Polarisedimenticolia bacterium]